MTIPWEAERKKGEREKEMCFFVFVDFASGERG
jgi:hypothetical protein